MRSLSSILVLGALAMTAGLSAQTFVRKIPELPALHTAMDVAVDSAGDIWVACWQINQIVKLSPTGQELARVGPVFRSGSSGPSSFGTIFSIATAPGGHVYAVSGLYVSRFDSSGNFVSWFGGGGTGPGQFANSAGGVAVAPGGDVYVVDQFASRVQRFDPIGGFLAAFGSAGSAPGQFNFAPASGYAIGIEVDAAGSVYVVDPGNDRVQKFDSAGTPILSFPVAIMSNRFSMQTGITVEPAGKIHVSRRGTPCLQTFDASGALLSQTVGVGVAPDGQLTADVGGVTADAAGNLYTAEMGVGRVQEFDPTGNFVARFGCSVSQDDGQFWGASGVAWTATGELLVGETGTTRVQRFSQAGQFLGKITAAFGSSLATDSQGNLYLNGVAYGVRKYSSTGTLLATIGSGGTGPGQFQSISGIAVDPAGQIWVADGTLNRVQKFDAGGALLLGFGSSGTADGQFRGPQGLAIAANGDVLVADNQNHRIQRFDADGMYLSKITTGGVADFTFPASVAVDAAGMIFVGGYGNHRINVFGPTGSFITKFGAPGGGSGEVANGTGIAVFGGMLAVADRLNNRVQIFDVTTLDTQVPIVSITSPAAGAVLGSYSVAVSGTVSDLSATTVASNPQGVFAQLPAGGGSVGATLSFTGADGPRLLTLSALDATGRTGGTSLSFTIDTTAPIVTVTSPLENAVVGTALATITVGVTDLTATTLSFSHGGGTRTLPNGGGVASTVVTLAEGPNAITVQVTDAAGNQRTVTRNVVADLSVPIVTITSPADGGTFGVGASPVPVSALVDDLSATTVTSTPAGVSASLPGGGGSAFGPVGLAEGTNTITVRARDAFSREGTASITVVLDTTAPTLTIDAPLSGARVRGTIDVAVSADDPLPGSGVASVSFSVDGNPIATDTEAPFEVSLDTTTLSDGNHTVMTTVTDGKGNARPGQVTVLVDNTRPAVQFTGPAANAVVGGSALAIHVDAADGGSGLRSVTMRVGSVAPSTDGSVVFGVPVAAASPASVEDTTRWPDGALLLTVSVVDDAGNEASAILTVIVDNTAPASALLSPADGARVSGVVSIVAATTEPNLQSLLIKVDSVVVGSTSAASLTVPYDTSGRPEGPMVIEVCVTDRANNQSVARATVQVVNFTYEFNPRTLNLKAKGHGVVTAHVEGPNVASLLPLTSHVIELRVQGGNPVHVLSAGGVGDADGDAIPDMTLRFDRQTLIASIRAGIAGNYLPAEGDIDVQLVLDGSVIATAKTRVNQ